MNTPAPFTISYQGYSMYPFLRPGDRLLVRQVPCRKIQVGDIVVTGNGNGPLIAHRLVKLLEGGKGITKGDSLLAPDPRQVRLSMIVGRVEAVIRRGHRWIPISSGFRGRVKGMYAVLSLNGLTWGALKLKLKRRLQPRTAWVEETPPDRGERFLRDVLVGGTPSWDPQMNWSGVFGNALSQGTAGILFDRLKGGLLPEPVRSQMAQVEHIVQATAALNLVRLTALDGLEQALAQERLQVMAFKGISLLDRVYPRLGMRPLGDVDLMVRPHDRERFAALLLDIGYGRDRHLLHLFRKGGVAVDLHVHALNADRIPARRLLFPGGMGPLWAASRPWKPGFRFLRRPDDRDHVLILSQHLLKHSFSRLIWLVDIYFLLKDRDTPFWARLADRAASLGQQRPLCYTIYLLKRVLGFQPPEDWPAGHFKGLTPAERGILDQVAGGASYLTVGPLLGLFCIPGLGNRLRYAWQTLLPGRRVIKKEFQRPDQGHGTVFLRARFVQLRGLLTRNLVQVLRALFAL